MTPGFNDILTAAEADRRDLFLSTSLRLGTPIQNVENAKIILNKTQPVTSLSTITQEHQAILATLDIKLVRRHAP